MKITFDVCIQNLAKYTEGILIFKWVELPMDEEQLKNEVKEILKSDEELMIADYNTNFGYSVPEFENVFELNKIAERIQEIVTEEEHLDVLKCCTGYSGMGTNEALKVLEEGNYRVWEGGNEQDLGETLVEEGNFAGYINYIPDTLKDYRYGKIRDYYAIVEIIKQLPLDYEAIGRTFTFSTSGCFEGDSYIEIW